MQNLDELLEMWQNDSILDRTEPGKELLNIPKLHSKYLKILSEHNLLLKTIKDSYAKERKHRFNYYKGHYNSDKDKLQELGLEPFKLIVTDINMYLDSDDKLITLTSKKAYCEEIIKACEYIITELKSRTYQLRDYIAWVKFSEGG